MNTETDSEMKPHAGDAEFAAIQEELDELESFVGPLGLDDDDEETSSETSELDQALAGSEFATDTAESTGELSFIELADGDDDDDDGDDQQEGFRSIVRRVRRRSRGLQRWVAKQLTRKTIKWVLKYIRKAAKYRKCIPSISAALRAFKRKKYGTALKQAYRAAKCIRKQR